MKKRSPPIRQTEQLDEASIAELEKDSPSVPNFPRFSWGDLDDQEDNVDETPRKTG